MGNKDGGTPAGAARAFTSVVRGGVRNRDWFAEVGDYWIKCSSERDAHQVAEFIANELSQSFVPREDYERFKQGHDRYEKLRLLNPREFSELFCRGLDGENFDEMVDSLPEKGKA